MALIWANCIEENCDTTSYGTGPYKLNGATTGIGQRAFSAVCATGDTFRGRMVDTVTGDYVTALWTYNSTTNTVTATTIEDSSNSGSAVTFASGNVRKISMDATAAVFGAAGATQISVVLASTYVGGSPVLYPSWAKFVWIDPIGAGGQGGGGSKNVSGFATGGGGGGGGARPGARMFDIATLKTLSGMSTGIPYSLGVGGSGAGGGAATGNGTAGTAGSTTYVGTSSGTVVGSIMQAFGGNGGSGGAVQSAAFGGAGGGLIATGGGATPSVSVVGSASLPFQGAAGGSSNGQGTNTVGGNGLPGGGGSGGGQGGSVPNGGGSNPGFPGGQVVGWASGYTAAVGSGTSGTSGTPGGNGQTPSGGFDGGGGGSGGGTGGASSTNVGGNGGTGGFPGGGGGGGGACNAGGLNSGTGGAGGNGDIRFTFVG